MVRKVDYIIVGQGLAGSAMAWELMQRGKSVIVFDEPAWNRASAVAAGLFNPITGRVMTLTWKADILFPFLEKFYQYAEQKLQRRFFHPLPVFRPFISIMEKAQWMSKSETGNRKDFIAQLLETPSFAWQVRNPHGGLEIARSGYLDMLNWISAVRHHLEAQDFYREELFQEDELSFTTLVRYKQWEAGKIIFCNGLRALQSKWFDWLPLRPLKGETINVRVSPALQKIYNRGVFIVPSAGENIYKVGATYQHAPFQESITQSSKKELEMKLTQLIQMPFETIHQDWGIRPTTPDRKPLLGSHPQNNNVTIFNGLGTKGVSLAPYFAHQMADWLEGLGELSHEVNIFRFKSLYSGLLQ